MDTKQTKAPSKPSSLAFLPEYKAVIIEKSDSQEVHGIAALGDADILYVKEIGTDREHVLSMVDTLNHYRIPYEHFLEVLSDLMNESC